MKRSKMTNLQPLSREQMKQVNGGTGPEFCAEQGQGYVFCGLPSHSIHYYDNCCEWGRKCQAGMSAQCHYLGLHDRLAC